jgi:hypothetical protein
MRRERCDRGWEGCNRNAVGWAGGRDEVSEVGSGTTSLNRCELVGLSRPCKELEASEVVPAEGCWSGLKSEEGEAEEMKVEWAMSVDPSTSLSACGARRWIDDARNEPRCDSGFDERNGNATGVRVGVALLEQRQLKPIPRLRKGDPILDISSS